MTLAGRLLVVSLLLLLTTGYLARTMRAEPAVRREALSSCPLILDDWHGQQAPTLDGQTLSLLGVDDYINRIYLGADMHPVSLYVGYYASQREGDTMHSPLNCLPGAGWSPVSVGRIAVPVATAEAGASPRTITVNRYVIEKGLDRQLVLYWYQSHGRVVASEYWGKIYLVLDAIRTNRTDGALVRIIAPITTTESDAERQAVDFAEALCPLLDRYLPS
jgi:EpsI family protein